MATLPLVDVPEAVAAGTHRLMEAFGLVYTASDWIVTPSGRWTFLGDLDPTGQRAWIERCTGLPLADALAGELTPEQP